MEGCSCKVVLLLKLVSIEGSSHSFRMLYIVPMVTTKDIAIEYAQRKWERSHYRKSAKNINGKVSRVQGLDLIEMSVIHKAIDWFSAILSTSQCKFFAEVQKFILKFTWNLKGPQIAKTFLNKNKVGGVTFPDFKMYQRATVIETVWFWHKDRERPME